MNDFIEVTEYHSVDRTTKVMINPRHIEKVVPYENNFNETKTSVYMKSGGIMSVFETYEEIRKQILGGTDEKQ